MLGFSTLLVADGFATYALGMAAFALFSTSIVPLIDSLSLEAVREAGASYSHLRICGSLGFVVASLSVGLLVPKLDGGAVRPARLDDRRCGVRFRSSMH